MRVWALIAIALFFGTQAFSEPPRELGDVNWARDFARAEARAKETDRPLFALFQEVPGCQTCVSFGEQVLSHPLLVEAIESEFVPVAVFNNHAGEDRRLLERFSEPSYNNPVVRFLDGDGEDLLPRKDGVWFPREIGARMVAALDAAERPVPTYLREVVDELSATGRERATFAMHCFWAGEACLGEIDGVLASKAGWLDGREVVELTFDPAVVSYDALLRATLGCSDAVYTHSDDQQRVAEKLFGDNARGTHRFARVAKDSDQKRALRGTFYATLELTPKQAVRVNAAIAANRSPTDWLSPRQQLMVLPVAPTPRDRTASPAGQVREPTRLDNGR